MTAATDNTDEQRHRQPRLRRPAVELDATQNPGLTLSTTDPDGTTAFTYAWRHVTTTAGNTNCSSNCIFGGATATVDARQARRHDPDRDRHDLHAPDRDRPAGGAASDDQLHHQQARQHRADGDGDRWTRVRDVRHGRRRRSAGTATDPQTTATPPQTLTYQWTQVDGAGVPLPVE